MTGPNADSAVVRATRAADRRGRRVRRRNRGPTRATLYVMVIVGVIALAILVQFAVHMARTDPRDSRAIAMRELQVNSLQPGERVFRRSRCSSDRRSTTSARRAACCVLTEQTPAVPRTRAARSPRGARSAADVRGARFPARHDGARHLGTHFFRNRASGRDHHAAREDQARRAFGAWPEAKLAHRRHGRRDATRRRIERAAESAVRRARGGAA